MSCKIRPQTPEPTDKYSKRQWDRTVVQWKRALQHVTGDYLTFEYGSSGSKVRSEACSQKVPSLADSDGYFTVITMRPNHA